ncbi:MAG: glycosyltransferase [Gemmiger sp.]|nr:glycosyltransferase [Gemmiger sp.]
MENKKPKVAIIHDWLVAYAGADRVLDRMVRIFPGAVVYTLVYDKANMPAWFAGYDIRTTYIQKLPFATKIYKALLPFMPAAFEALDLSEYDMVISSCSSCSKGVITRPDAVHICYCNTPIRYAWDFYYTYRDNASWLAQRIMPHQMHKLRQWDKCAADRVDYFIANSHFIAKRIKKYYRRDSDVIYPCVHINPQPLLPKEDFYLVVGRFTWYKRMDLAVAACTQLGRRLVVVGTGGEEKRLRALAGPTIEFKGTLSDEEIQSYYLRAKAFLFPGEEDFGITPVEAQSAGTPVLAYGRGGACETVADGKTGLLFHAQTVEALVTCIEQFEAEGVSDTPAEIRNHSLRFSEERFDAELKAYCEKRYADWQQALRECSHPGGAAEAIDGGIKT